MDQNESSNDGEILDETQAFIPGTQAFDADFNQTQQTQAFDVSVAGDQTQNTQAFDLNETVAEGDEIPSTQAFAVKDPSSSDDETSDDDEGKKDEDMPMTQAFETTEFEEADRIIGDKLIALSHPEPGDEYKSAESNEDDAEANEEDSELKDDVAMPPPRASVADFEAIAPVEDSVNATQAFDASSIQEDIGSPDYPVRDTLEETGDADLFSATQPFDVSSAPAGPSFVEDSTVFSENADTNGPRSPSPENQGEVPEERDDGPRSPTPLQDENDGPKSPDPETDEEGPPKSPDDHPSIDDDDDDDDEIVRTKKPQTEADGKSAEDSDDGDSDDEKEKSGSPPKRKRVLLSDDEEDDEDSEGEGKEKPAGDGETPGSPPASPKEGEEEEKEKAEPDEDDALIADIFGEEHEYEGEEEGRDKEDMGDGSSHAGTSGGIGREDKEWDFDVMMKKKKSESKRRRRRKDGSIDLQSDADEFIRELINKMKYAAEDDRKLNKEGKPALKKRVMLSYVKTQLMKCDYKEALVDCGIISALAEWLAPLPDKSLPALEIRTHMLKLLQQFDIPHSELKKSGIGKATMILYKHPKETKKNREIAGKLIGDWSRPIFELETDYRKLSREDRERRDYDQLPESKKQRLSSTDDPAGTKEDERPLRPGDKGWIGRARVPQPSKKDYVVRPKSKVEVSMNDRKGRSKGTSSALDKKLKEYNNRIRKGGALDHAVTVSIEGRKMQI